MTRRIRFSPHTRFAVGRAAGSTGSDTRFRFAVPADPLLIQAARNVLRITQAMVIGPTPPGTGEIAPAISLASLKATSPTSFVLPASPGTRLMPTSITVAPGLIQLPRTISGRPTAAKSKSARRQTSARSLVLECAIVTVAFSASNNCASGLPTMLERPTTTASIPDKRRMNRLRHPHGAERRARNQRRQAGGEAADIHRMKSVNVFRRIDGVEHSRGIDLLGQRKLHENPVHALIGVELCHKAHELVLRDVRRQLVIERSHAPIDNGFRLRADIDFARRIVAGEHDSKAGHKIVPRFQFGRSAGNLCAQILRDRLTVDDRCWHVTPPVAVLQRP